MSLRNRIDRLLRNFEQDFTTHNTIEVSSSAIYSNIDFFSEQSKRQVIPVLKGNAYGHGLATVAKILRQRRFSYVAVDGYFEALRIREVSDQPVLVMGAIRAENYTRLRYDDFAFVVQDAEAINALGATGRRINIHLECNTGMNRYGVKAHELSGILDAIRRHDNLRLEGVMSHLADSDGDDRSTVDTAVRRFDDMVANIYASGLRPTIVHIAQSAGSLQEHSKYATHIRLGLGMYGINPFPSSHKHYKLLQKYLKPALRLTSTITHTIDLQKGEGVSYNYTFTADKPMRIGVMPIGYYEGVPRALSNAGHVKLQQAFVPIIGRVCMNHTMINLESTPARKGDTVIVISNNPADRNSIASISHTHGLFNYQLLTSLSSDIRRIATA